MTAALLETLEMMRMADEKLQDLCRTRSNGVTSGVDDSGHFTNLLSSLRLYGCPLVSYSRIGKASCNGYRRM